jgi:3-methylcrotonyl-CoA carboxylase alpha subunit
VYAEDPAREFLPSIGVLSHLHQPAASAHVRVDTGVRAGDAISPHYDPMIAKLIVWGEDRAIALRHLRAALAEYEVVGVQTNLALLRAIAGHGAFGGGTFDTGVIGRYADGLMPPAAVASPAVLATAVLAMLEVPAPVVASEDRWSPWNAADAWRMNGDGYQDLVLRDGEAVLSVRAWPGAAGVRLGLPGGDVVARAEPGGVRVDGVVHRLRVVRQGDAIVVIQGGANRVLHPVDPLAPPAAAASGGGKVTAPIPGRVARILVAPGDAVVRGAALLVIEAMKMELTLSAPMDGVIASIRPVVDEMVQEGTELVTFVVDG